MATRNLSIDVIDSGARRVIQTLRMNATEVLAVLARQLEWLSRVSEPVYKEKQSMVDMHNCGASFAYRHAAALVDKAIESIGPTNDQAEPSARSKPL